MKAPDKIYFEIDEKGKVHAYFGLQPDNATEYIRKDALLKWIQEARAIPHENAITRDLAFQEVIDKLNEM